MILTNLARPHAHDRPAGVAGMAGVAAPGLLDLLDLLDAHAERNLEAVAQLATSLCDAPSAMVGLVAADRQWCRARVGFPHEEVGLDASICVHALDTPDLLVIEDLSRDARTRSSPLVCGPPFLRFYAGAPLRTADGHVLGTLCVMDTQPRPGGLTARQRRDLRALARQAMAQIELRRLLHERDALIADQAAATAALREKSELLQTVTDHAGQAICQMDERGDITFANPAATAMFGWPREEMIGRNLHDLLHHTTADGRPFPATECPHRRALGHGRLLSEVEDRFFRRDGAPIDVVVTNAPVQAGGAVAGAVMTISDVTERKRVKRELAASIGRKTALARLGDELRAAPDAAAMGPIASRIAGETLRATVAAYAAVDAARGTLTIASSWCVAGAAAPEGTHALRDFGSCVEELKAGRAVAVADVAADGRTRGGADACRRLGVAAFVNVPIIEQGELVALLLVLFDRPRSVGAAEEAFGRALADRTRAAIARAEGEERQALLNIEISHRLKNTLAMVQAIAKQTLKGSSDQAAVAAFDLRLLALSTAHDALLREDWTSADLGELAGRVLDAAGAADRYDARGPALRLGPRAALSTSMLLHELATNAAKYGALSRPDGRIEVDWREEDGADAAELVLSWREVGGPPAVEPARRGFGSRLLRMGLVGTGGSSIRYEPTGLEATFRAPRAQVERV